MDYAATKAKIEKKKFIQLQQNKEKQQKKQHVKHIKLTCGS